MEEMIKTAGQTAMESGKEVNNTSSVKLKPKDQVLDNG